MSDIDHLTIISRLTQQERDALLEKSDRAGLMHLAAHVGLIVLTGLLIYLAVPGWPLLLLPQGVLIVFLFTLLHETVHRTPFRSDRLNIWIGRFCGLAVFLGPDWFRYFHLAHHRYTHDPQKDPELASPKPTRPLAYLVYMTGLPDLASRLQTIVRNAFRDNQDPYVPPKGKRKVKREAQIYLGLYLALIALSFATGSAVLLWLWLLPYLLGAPFLRAYLLAEHTRCPHVPSMLENTRTTFTNRLVRFLAWNMPYHAEHHAYPSVPFHKLPAFHAYIRAHTVHLQDGYLGFNGAYFRDVRSGELAQELNQSEASETPG